MLRNPTYELVTFSNTVHIVIENIKFMLSKEYIQFLVAAADRTQSETSFIFSPRAQRAQDTLTRREKWPKYLMLLYSVSLKLRISHVLISLLAYLMVCGVPISPLEILSNLCISNFFEDQVIYVQIFLFEYWMNCVLISLYEYQRNGISGNLCTTDSF